jgi:hypothetical protein
MSNKFSLIYFLEGGDMKIEMVAVKDLIPYATNARTHSDEQVEQLARCITEFGFNNPVLIDPDNGIIAGHGRLLAAVKLGMNKIPCIRLSHLSEVQKRAFIIADNKMPELAGWNDELLAAELERLNEDQFDIEMIGFSKKELDDLLSEDLGGAGSSGSGGMIEQAIQLKPPKEYILVVCDGGEYEFDKLKEIFNLQPVRRGGYKVGSSFDAVGMQRVVKADHVISIFNGGNDDSCNPE